MSLSPTRPLGERAHHPGLSGDLLVLERPSERGWDDGSCPIVVLVHGSLDRASSFLRASRRLPDVGIFTYDRRGYQGSRAAGPARDFAIHVHDLIAIATAYARREHVGGAPAGHTFEGRRTRPGPLRPISAVGHSIGASIVLAAAVARPDLFVSAGAHEPSMPWLGFRGDGVTTSTGPNRARHLTTRTEPPGLERDPGHDPATEAECFFRRMAGDGAWERLSDAERANLRADGSALLADAQAVRSGAPTDVSLLSVPTIVASGDRSAHHHRQTADGLDAHVPCVSRVEIPGAGHGAHLSHPDAFAALVRDVVTAGCTRPGEDGQCRESCGLHRRDPLIASPRNQHDLPDGLC